MLEGNKSTSTLFYESRKQQCILLEVTYLLACWIVTFIAAFTVQQYLDVPDKDDMERMTTKKNLPR